MRPSESRDFRKDLSSRKRLLARLEDLASSLRRHEKVTSKRLPQDDEEASILKTEIGILETQEKSEAGGIRLVQDALERLEKGTYGVCLTCRGPIGKERLRALPEASLCQNCQSRAEQKSAGENWAY